MDALESMSAPATSATVRETLERFSQAALKLRREVCALVPIKQSLRKASIQKIAGKDRQRPKLKSGFRCNPIQLQ
jgi:hypothetical protein